MEQYAVMLYGENYLLDQADKPLAKYSFYVWRCVEAIDISMASTLAIQMVHNDREFNSAIRNAPDDPPRLSVKKVCQGFGKLHPPGSGFIIFESGDNEKEPSKSGLWRSISEWVRKLGRNKD